MRKILLVTLLFAGACRSRTTEAPVTEPTPAAVPNVVGAVSPRLAVDAFLAAIRAQDLQALASVWGDKNGPARDSKVFSRDEMEQREIILIRCFKHDRFRVLGETPAADSERSLQVELVRGTVTRVTDFYTARSGTRWFVRNANLEPVRELCSTK